MFLVQMLHAATFGFTHLGTMHYIRENVPDHMQNSVQGIYSALSSGMLMSATMWSSGPLYSAFGGHAFFVMAGVAAIACGLAITLRAVSPRAA
jgi:PPP family 3-phenylpropionic acid transporter